MRAALIALMLTFGSQAGADVTGEEILVHGTIINKGLVNEHLPKKPEAPLNFNMYSIKWYHVIYDEKFYNCWVQDHTPLKDFGVTITCDGVRPTE